MKNAFTLAEMLTTLLIIGVISAIVVPVFNSTIQEKVSEGQIKTFKTKFNEALNYMQIKGALATPYNNTAEFLAAMNKYANITKICDSNNLDKCFTAKIYENDNKTPKYKLSDLHTSEDIEANFIDGDLGAIVFSDGTSALVAYEPGCFLPNTIDLRANVQKCLCVIYDVNGKEAPNSFDYDIGYLDSDDENDPYKDIDVFPLSYMPRADCVEWQTTHSSLARWCADQPDYWVWATEKCNNKNKRLPRYSELRELAEAIYGKGKGINNTGTYTGEVVNKKLFKKITNGAGSVTIYTSENEYSYNNVPSRTFNSTGTFTEGAHTKRDPNAKAYCVDK